MKEETLDKELNNMESLSVAVRPPLPFEKPDRFINIPSDVIINVSLYLSIVINKKTDHRNVDAKRIFENAQSMFRDGVRYHDNLWLHHCASSMREVICFLEPDDFHTAHSSIPAPTDPSMDAFYNFFMSSKAYLSDVVHFCDSAKIGNADKIYPGQGYGQKSKDDFLANEHLFFEKLCIDLVYTLHDLFTRYCIGSTNESN